MNASAAAPPLRFGRFEVDPHERRLSVDGEAVVLGARAFDLLLALAERPGRLVTKRDLMDLVWPGQVVQENNLAAQMSALRKVLGEDVIATIPGRGYRFVARVEAAAAPAAAEANATPPAGLRTNLPATLPALRGREEELRTLGDLVDRHRLVSVVGAGGIGKSLLTQHLLVARRQAYPQGVCWVELGPLADGAALPGAIATALGVEGGRGDPRAALLAALAPLTLLLALDNAEHLLEPVASLVRDLHEAAPGVRLVVTSQAPLRLAAEHVLRVGTLTVPAGALAPAQALGFGAVALFVERVQAADARFALDGSNVAAVVEVCRALDGLPLALELAAARVPALGLPQLLSSMNERLRLLTRSRDRGAPARQQTLRAALEWSHGLLDVREQRVLRRLGVVVGGAGLGFLQRLLAEDEADAWAVLDALDLLVERSLVAAQECPAGGGMRYRLPESTRAFALEALRRAGEHEALQRRHGRATAALLDAAYDRYFDGSVGADDWMAQVGADLDNAREAWAWAAAAGETEMLITLGATLLRALPASQHVERMALADTCEARAAEAASARQCQRLWVELACARADTQKPRARSAAAQALALARALEHEGSDPWRLYHALCRFASAAAQAGDPAAAQAALEELRPLEDLRWPPQRLVWGEEARHAEARMRGDVAATLAHGRRLLALDRARGSAALTSLGNLIDTELAAGDARAAARTGVELVAALQGTRDEYSLAFGRVNLVAAYLALDDVTQARAVLQAAWSQSIAFEMPHVVGLYAALLAALENRPRCAAVLLGHSEGEYGSRGETRETNETAASERAARRAREALGDEAFARLHAQGAALSPGRLRELAFTEVDAA